MFYVFNLDTQAYVLSSHGDDLPAIYETGYHAAAAAKVLTAQSGIKHQPRKIVEDVSWRERERARFADGTYTCVPWSAGNGRYYSLGGITQHKVPKIVDHFPHVSKDDPGMMAYTPDANYGSADRQVRIRPRRYLQQFLGEIRSAAELDHWAGEFARLYAPIVVCFAETEDDIEAVYTAKHAPSSCMAHDASHFSSNIHPVRVYAAGDLAVAYVGTLDGENTSISERAICWPARKIYGRVYGSGGALARGLEQLGYRCAVETPNDFNGARLLRLCQGDNFIVPYVDGVYRACDDGKHLILDYRGDVNCENTNGLSGSLAACDHCGEVMDEVDECVVGDTVWCTSCYERYAFRCDRCAETYAIRFVNRHRMRGRALDEIWCETCFAEHGATCDATDHDYDMEDTVTLKDGRVWGQDYFDRRGYQCQSCGECFANGDCCDDGPCCCDEQTEQADEPVSAAA